MAKVIGICNSKGGVGKTTTTDAMGAGLVKLGKKVLLVDADDSNPSLSKVHGFYDEPVTITDLMLFTSCGRLREAFLDEVIKKTSEGVDIIPNDEKLPNIKPALLADAIATSAGAIIGTSTTTTYVESSAGVGAGARTGLASVVTAVLFLLAIFFAPIFTAIPGFATAPALIFVGFLMISSVAQIDFNDLTEAVPAYMTILAMPFAYSIAEGISLGVISYVIINVICGKAKKVTPLMYILAVLFVCKYIFL